MSWLIVNLAPLLNIVGISCDIVGAFLIATEVVNQFNGQKFKRGPAYPPGLVVAPPPPTETDEFKAWDLAKYRYMRVGLIVLVLGFLIQIVANALQFRSAA